MSDDGQSTVIASPRQDAETFLASVPPVYLEPVVVLQIRNKGRTQVSITDAAVELPDRSSYRRRDYAPNVQLPHRLQEHDELSWYIPASEIVAVAEARGWPLPIRVRGVVRLGTGKPKASRMIKVGPLNR